MPTPPKGRKILITMQLDLDLLEAVEAAQNGQSRQGFIADALRAYLKTKTQERSTTTEAPKVTP